MSIVDGRWDAGPDIGDYDRPASFRDASDLASIAAGQTFDVVIVGAGGAGAAAAIEATDRGASILVLEKMDYAGGSTQVSGGTIRVIADKEHALDHYRALAQGSTPDDVFAAYIDGLMEVPEWIASHGGKLVQDNFSSKVIKRRVCPVPRVGSAFPNFPYPDAMGPRSHMQPMRPDRPYGAALWDFLRATLGRLEVPVVTGVSVKRLLQSFPERRVVGVVAEVDGQQIEIAARAVILACGGFAWDRDMMRQYYGVELPAASPVGRNTGDGIRMAQDVGADLWHMTATSSTLSYKVPEIDAALPAEIPDPGFIMVDQRGRRYASETDMETHSFTHPMLVQDPAEGHFLRIPSYIIVDETTRKAGRLATTGLGANRHYPWSEDNQTEIDRGWIIKADTIAELAEKLDLPVAQLERTIADFNADCAAGEGDRFGRKPELMRPISNGPFYGAAVYPALLNTQGGPRRDADCHVLRPDGSAISGLYSAGELGSIWSRLYPGGGNVSEAIVTGRRSAQSAIEFARTAMEPAEA